MRVSKPAFMGSMNLMILTGLLLAPPMLAEETGMITIQSFTELNFLPDNVVGVFIYLPDGMGLADAPVDTIRGAIARLEPFLEGGTIGMYALAPGSPDYNQLTSMIALPGILAMARGRGAAAATGSTRSSLVSAFLSASSSSGCGPSGCGI